MIPPPPLFENASKELAVKLNLTGVEFKARGAFKETYSATTAQGEIVALKILDPKKTSIERTSREIDAMRRCASAEVARLIDYGTLDTAGETFVFVIEEYFDGGTVADRPATSFSADGLRYIGLKLGLALKTLDQNRIVHRDIKPENVMYRSGSDDPVLVDFGLVRDLSMVSLTQSWVPQGPGTPLYSSPEQLNNDKAAIDWRSDQFSLGILIGTIGWGKHPFDYGSGNPADFISRIATRQEVAPGFASWADANRMETLTTMLKPWPFQRLNRPDELITAFGG